MSCEHLICASCAGPVAEARCPACRAARAQVHHHHTGLSIPWIAALLIALMALGVMLQQLSH